MSQGHTTHSTHLLLPWWPKADCTESKADCTESQPHRDTHCMHPTQPTHSWPSASQVTIQPHTPRASTQWLIPPAPAAVWVLTCPSGTDFRHTSQEAGLPHHLASCRTSSSCELRGSRAGHWQECEGKGPRPRIFPLWPRNHVSVPLETGA